MRINVGAPREVWGISRAAQNAMPSFHLISRNGRQLDQAALRHCIPGMPIFMPRSNYGVNNAKMNRKGLPRPAAWPENAW